MLKMNASRSNFLLLLFFVCIPVFANWELKDSVEFQKRDGLPNFIQKVKSGEQVSIGFFGGSITEASGYRPKFVEWCKTYFKNENITGTNAAIGGTNSKYGVFRIENHLLSKGSYDLIFVEFAVNDGGGESVDVEKSMEGIVQKIWNENPNTDICFLFTVKKEFLEDIDLGKMNLSATKHDSIASYYGIPTMFFGVEVEKQLRTDSVVFYDSSTDFTTSKNELGQNVITRDNVHPTDYGHETYAKVMSRSIVSIEDMSYDFPHPLKDCIVESNYKDAKMLPVQDIQNHGMIKISEIGQNSEVDKFLVDGTTFMCSQDTAAQYCFEFTGNMVGINLLLGPAGGKYEIKVDDKCYTYKNFDGYSSNNRYAARFINVPEGKHQVTINCASEGLSLDEKSGILNNDSRRLDLQNNPEKYDKNELLFSDIFIVGELNNVNVGTIDTEKDDLVQTAFVKAGVLTIRNTDPEFSVYIYDINGCLVHSVPTFRSDILNINLHKKGIYFVRFTNSNSSNVIKVLNN